MFTALWLLWGVAFLVIEGAALVSKQKGSTLSEHIWQWFMVKDPARNTAAAWVLRTVLGLFLAWLTAHLTGQPFHYSGPSA